MLPAMSSVGSDNQPNARSRESAQRAVEQTFDTAREPARAEGGPWATLIALIALILSVFSLYETVLKQARPTMHVGAVMYYAREPEGVEVFAVPVTITNHGARDAVVTAIDLGVSPAGSDAAAVAFASAYVGTGPNPLKDRQPFTPLPIPGRGSYTGLILLYPADLKSPAAQAVKTGEATYRFCAAMRIETSQELPILEAWLEAAPQATSFEAQLPWFAARALDASEPIQLPIKSTKRHTVSHLEPGSAPTCD